MKKILKKLSPYLFFALFLFLIKDQGEFYLDKEVLEPSFLQWIIFFGVLYLIVFVFCVWVDSDERPVSKVILNSLGDSLWFSGYAILLLFLLQSPIKNTALLVNRVYASEQKVYQYKIEGINSWNFVNHVSHKNDSTLLFIRYDFPELKEVSLQKGDSLYFQTSKGLFGLEYIHQNSTKIIKSEK